MAPSSDSPADTPPSILFVTADEDLASRISTGLNQAGFLVSVVSSGRAALDKLGDTAVDCLLVDPDTDDLTVEQLVASLRARPDQCPVIWLPFGDTDPIDDDVLDVPTTIVQQGAVGDDCAFLIRKLRGLLATESPRGADRSTFKALVESASDGLYTLDAAGRVTYLNESFAAMLGYDRADLIGTHASSVMVEGELERGQEVVEALLAEPGRESDVMDMEMRTRDGEVITVAAHYSVLTGEDGTYEGLMGVVRDITERKRRERELARQRDRLDEFAGVVSHDLRNPLNLAAGHLELAMDECDSEHLTTVAEAHDRMKGLIDDVLSLARAGETVGDPEPVALADVIHDAWQTVGTPTAEFNAFSELEVMADERRFRELVENLVGNAIDHGGEKVTVTVGDLDDGFYVADNGPGISPDDRESVFEHGYTTTDDGTGFGLTIVEDIATAHGWEVAVTESEAGGARVEITGMAPLDG